MFVKLRNIVLAACVFITFSIVTKFDVFYILRNPGAKSLNIHSRENNELPVVKPGSPSVLGHSPPKQGRPGVFTRHSSESPLVYKPPISSGVAAPGEPFNVSQSLLWRLNLPPKSFFSLSPKTVRKFVFVTAVDQPHFPESTAAVSSVHRQFPGYHVHYYDLGLSSNARKQVQSWCNVTLHRFNFSRYPDHVRNLSVFSWKFLVLQDALHKYGAVFWIDASFRSKHTVDAWQDVFQLALRNGGLVMPLPRQRNLSNYAFTDPNMYKLLPTDVARQKTVRMVGAGALLIYNTRTVYNDILHWVYLCSLDARCCPPTTHRERPIWRQYTETEKRNMTLFKIHRHDQAALNLLLSNKFGYDLDGYSTVSSDDKRHIDIVRHPESHDSITTC